MDQLYLAIKIFQIFEDYRTIYDQDKTGLYVWLGNYLQWTQSPMLKSLWDRLYHNYKDSTISFTNFLFEQGDKLNTLRKIKGSTLTPDEYILS